MVLMFGYPNRDSACLIASCVVVVASLVLPIIYYKLVVAKNCETGWFLDLFKAQMTQIFRAPHLRTVHVRREVRPSSLCRDHQRLQRIDQRDAVLHRWEVLIRLLSANGT